MRKRKQEEQQMEESKVLRVIRDGKLYDTGKAEYLATIWTKLDSIESRTCFWSTLGSEPVDLYKGNTEYFVVYGEGIWPVTEEWVKREVGLQDVDLYIKLFGEPELA